MDFASLVILVAAIVPIYGFQKILFIYPSKIFWKSLLNEVAPLISHSITLYLFLNISFGQSQLQLNNASPSFVYLSCIRRPCNKYFLIVLLLNSNLNCVNNCYFPTSQIVSFYWSSNHNIIVMNCFCSYEYKQYKLS